MRVTIRGGEQADIATPGEVREIFGAELREAARGVKWMRLPLLSGAIANSAITLGITKGQPPVGPEQGYAWAITRLVVTGLKAAATPDIVNVYLNDNFSGPVWWQFNGNNFGYTFDPPLILTPGDTLSLQNSGSISATGTVSLSGELWQVPAEMLYKLRP